eukprot:GHVP01053056.1.p1 GENE.GHVP01053056.1~~GHVP01053056.1.p1  ORF type:complete len:363 (+),score=53.62 GHVP01053056.1:556-1644(+)
MLCKHSSLSISIAAIETSEGDTLFNSCMKVLNLLVSSLLANNYTLGDGSILSNLTTDYTPDDITMIISCMEFTKKLLSEIGLRTYILENQTESVNQEEVRSMKFKPFLSSILNQTNFWIFTFGKFPKVSTSILKSQTSGLLILREVFDLIRPDFSVASSPRLDSSSQIQSLQSVEKNWEYLSSKNGETFEDWRLLEDIHDIGLQKLRDLHGIRPKIELNQFSRLDHAKNVEDDSLKAYHICGEVLDQISRFSLSQECQPKVAQEKRIQLQICLQIIKMQFFRSERNRAAIVLHQSQKQNYFHIVESLPRALRNLEHLSGNTVDPDFDIKSLWELSLHVEQLSESFGSISSTIAPVKLGLMNI